MNHDHEGGRMTRTRRPMRWAVMLLAMIASAVAVIVPTGVVQATNEQATMMAPFNGRITSPPSGHPIYLGSDFAMDLAAGAGTPVRLNLANPTGSLRLEVFYSGRETCSSGNGGKSLRVRVYVDNVNLGWIYFGHLSPSGLRGNGPVSNGATIGYLAGGLPVNSSCWTGPHAHIELRNEVRYACYAQNTGSMNTSSPLGVIGGEWGSTVRTPCPPGATNPTPPPTYEAGFVDQHAFLDAGLTRPWNLNNAVPGQEGWLRFRVRNTGTATWSRGGSYPVRLGTQNPQDRSSAFRTSDWYSPNRPTAMSESTVGPGGTATFVFKVRVPAGNTSTREHFKVVAESRAWFGPTMWRDFNAPSCGGRRPTIVGTVGADTINGTSGNDVIAAFGGRDVINGLSGNDVICAGGGSDTVVGGGGADRLYGQRGNDVLVGQWGNDVHNGGLGRDLVRFDGATNRVVVDLGQQTATGWGSDRVVAVENVVGSPRGDVIRGDDRPNRLVGGRGNDAIVGRGGDDTLLGSRGSDSLYGGPQRDVCNGQLGRDRAFDCEVQQSIP